MSKKRHADENKNSEESPSKIQRSEQCSEERSEQQSEQRSEERSVERIEQRSGERSEERSVEQECSVENRFGVIPLEIKKWIFSFLTTESDVLSARRACREWRGLLTVAIHIPHWPDFSTMVMGVYYFFQDRIPFKLHGGVLSVNYDSPKDYVEAQYTIQDSDNGKDLAFTVPLKPLVVLLENIKKGFLDRTSEEEAKGSWNADISLVMLPSIEKILFTYPTIGKRQFKAVVGTIEKIEDIKYILDLPPPVLKIPININTFKFFRNIMHSRVLYIDAILTYIPGRWAEYGEEIVECVSEDTEDPHTQLLTLTMSTNKIDTDYANPNIEYRFIKNMYPDKECEYKEGWIPLDLKQVNTIRKMIGKPLSTFRVGYIGYVEKELDFYQTLFDKIQIRDVILHLLPDDSEGNPRHHIIEYNGRCKIKWYIAPIK
jgi:hypothetical protein